MQTPHPLQEIVSELTGERGTRPIPRGRVLDWMRTDDIECMGAIIGWFVWAWRDPGRRTSTVVDLKEWLAALYLAADSDLRICIVQATLEHWFENREVADYFSDWKGHPELSTAYTQAMKWVDGGGRSPFWIRGVSALSRGQQTCPAVRRYRLTPCHSRLTPHSPPGPSG